MEKKIKLSLPSNIQRLVDEIENFAGCEIQLRPNSSPLIKTKQDVIGCTASETEAIIYFYREEALIPQAVLHELLHIYRYWVEQVPQVLPVDIENEDRISVTSQIENSFEHLVIVPQEEIYGFDPFPYWNETFRKFWAEFEAKPENSWVKRKNDLLGWLPVHFLANDPTVKEVAKNGLRREGLLHEAERLALKIEKVLDDKPQAVAVITRFLKIPRNEARLVYMDIRNRKRIEKEISAH